MRRPSFGPASCCFASAALLGLAWMASCNLMNRSTPPGGTGDMAGIDQLGWGVAIALPGIAIPPLGIVGFLLWATGSIRPGAHRSLAERGLRLDGPAIVPSAVVIRWALP